MSEDGNGPFDSNADNPLPASAAGERPVWEGWAVRKVNPRADATKRIRATLEKRFAQEQWVVDRVRREAPHLLEGLPGRPPDARWVQDMIGRIETVSGNTHRWRRNYFVRALNRGTRELGWPSFPYQPVIALRLPNSPLNADTFPFIKRFRTLRKAFVDHLPDRLAFPESETRTARKGRILLSAVLFGGLCSLGTLRAFAGRNLYELHTHGDLLWMDWQEHRGTGSANWTRWFADPVTAMLLAHACTQGHWRLLEADAGKAEDLWPLLKAALASLGLPREDLPTSLRMLLAWGSAWLFRMLPPFLAHYATGSLETSALPPHVLERLLRGTPVSPHSSGSPAESTVEGGVASPYRPQPAVVESTDKSIQALRKILSGDTGKHSVSSGRKKVSRNREGIKNRLTAFRADTDLAPILQLLVDWAVHRLQRKVGVTVVWREHEAIDRRLVECIGLDDPLAYEADRLSDVYQSIADHPTPRQRHAYRVAALAQFHRYLMEHHGATPVDADIFDVVAVDGQVNANLISLPHAREILAELSPRASAHPPRLARFQQVAFLLSARCALRRGEILRARLADIGGAVEPSLVIRQRSGETLKSRQAERIVPLHAIMLPDELALVLDHAAAIRAEWEGKPSTIPFDDVVLFPREDSLGLPVTETSLFNPITSVMHRVTGDTTLSVHDGRHSGLGLDILVMIEEILPGSSALLGGPLPEDFQQRCQRYLLGRSRQSRQHLWAASLLAGHSSPGITLGSYFHVCDRLLWLALKAAQPDILPAERMAALQDLTPLRYRNALDRLGLPSDAGFAVLLEKVKEVRRYSPEKEEPDRRPTVAPLDSPAVSDNHSRFGIKSLDGKLLTASQLLVLLDEIDTLTRAPGTRTGTKTKTRVMPASTTLGSIAARHGIAEDVAEQLAKIVDALPHIAETRAGYRAKRGERAGTSPPMTLAGAALDFPVPRIRLPRSDHDRQLTARIYEALCDAWTKAPEDTVHWVVEHWGHADFETPTYRFESPSVAKRWVSFLLDLKFGGKPVLTRSDLELGHVPNGLVTEDQTLAHRIVWAKALDLSPDQISEAEPSKRRLGEEGKGLLRVALAFPEGRSRNWEAVRVKRGVADQRARLGSLALNVAAFLLLIQVIREDTSIAFNQANRASAVN